MVSQEQVQDIVRQAKAESDGYASLQFENLQQIMREEVQKLTDQAEMDSKTESFRAAGAGFEAQLGEGLGKIKAAQAAADAANLIQAESTRNTLTKLLEHDAEMRSLNGQNIARSTAKFAEVEAAQATAVGAPVGPLQR